MDAKRLEEIRERLAKTALRPWQASGWVGQDHIYSVDTGVLLAEVRNGLDGQRLHNAHFMANAPADVELLLEALDEAHDLIRILSTDSEAYRQGLSDGRHEAKETVRMMLETEQILRKRKK